MQVCTKVQYIKNMYNLKIIKMILFNVQEIRVKHLKCDVQYSQNRTHLRCKIIV